MPPVPKSLHIKPSTHENIQHPTLLLLPLTLNSILPPLRPPLRRRPDRHSTHKQKNRGNSTKPPHPNPINHRQTRRAPRRRKRVPNDIVPRHHFRAALLHHVQAVGV